MNYSSRDREKKEIGWLSELLLCPLALSFTPFWLSPRKGYSMRQPLLRATRLLAIHERELVDLNLHSRHRVTKVAVYKSTPTAAVPRRFRA